MVKKNASPRSTASASPLVSRFLLLAAAILCLNFTRDHVYTQDALDAISGRDVPARTTRSSLRGARSSLGDAVPGIDRFGADRAFQRARRGAPTTAASAGGEIGPALDRGEATEGTASPEADVVSPMDARAPELSRSAFERQLEEYGDPLIDRPIEQFGYDVFGKRPPPINDVPVGKDYIIGTGDGLLISLWGSPDIDQDYQLEVDRTGQIRLPMVGPVPLKGLSLGRAEAVLRNRFDRFYQNYELQVVIARIRDMPVHVTGHVRSPGRVRVSSVATLFDAIGGAGGVTKDGSLRAVRLRRPDEAPRSYDLYEYLIAGDRTVDVRLAPDDVIVVPPVGARVAIVGRVLRPAIYEQREGPVTFSEVLAMAGGYARLADRAEVQIETASSDGLSVRTVDLRRTAPERVELEDGDVVIVRSASPKLENVVYLRGNVARPGRYAYRDGMRVSDIVDENALVEAGFWRRRTAPAEREEDGSDDRPAGAASARRGEAPARDSRSAAADNVAGAGLGARPSPGPVIHPGSRSVSPRASEPPLQPSPEASTAVPHGLPGERLVQPLLEPPPESYPETYPEPFLEYALISRIDPRTRQESRIAFHLGKAIIEKDPVEDRLLMPQDTIVVFSRRDFEAPRTVFVTGAVHLPDDYEFYPGMKVLDLVRMAGGLRPEAHLASATLTRIEPLQGGTEYEHVVIDLGAVLSGDQEANIELQQNDSVTVKFVPDYKPPYRVTVSGEVLHPGTYSVAPGERVADLLRRAGGFTEHAYLPAAQFYRESVRAMQQERLDEALGRLETEAKLASQRYAAEASVIEDEKLEATAEQARIDRLLQTLRGARAQGRVVVRLRDPDALAGTADDVELENGDRIVVPRRPDVVHVVGAVFNQTALLHRDGMTARDSLRECGGEMDTADMSVAYIIRADGSADSARYARRGYHWDSDNLRYSKGDLFSQELHPGDTLVVPHDVKPRLSRWGLTKSITQIVFQTALATGVIVALF